MSETLIGKMAAIFVVSLLAFSSVSLVASGSNEEQDQEDVSNGEIFFGEALNEESKNLGLGIFDDANRVNPDMPTPVLTMAEGGFSPGREVDEDGDLILGKSKVLLVDDDAENWMSGPWIEASHIATALNDGGYAYDVFRAGRWNAVNKELPSGQAGVDLVNDYEVVIWYSGWNTDILSSNEQDVLRKYLTRSDDGDCSKYDKESSESFCTDNRNIFVSTQMSDWLDYRAGAFMNEMMHAETSLSSYLVVDGTSNPMQGEVGSIFEDQQFDTDTAGVHYLDRPCGNKATDNTATGAFIMDVRKDAIDGHKYHAVQFPKEGAIGVTQTHKSFLFADEIGVFNLREDRAAIFQEILDWMDVSKAEQTNVDIGISELVIPNDSLYWRSVEANVPVDLKVTVTNYGLLPQGHTAVKLKLKNEFGQVLFDSTFDTRAFPVGHAMNVPDSIQPGQSVVFTFNFSNDEYQRIYDKLDPQDARNVMFTSAGMDRIAVQVVHTGDQLSSNDYVQADVGVGKWIENAEGPDEVGPSVDYMDTDDNTVGSVTSHDGMNVHAVHSYDMDADGCGWAVDAETCLASGGTLNKTKRSVYHQGDHAFGFFNKNGWEKSNSDGTCVWGTDSLSDTGCPKFSPQPNQDDAFVSPTMDFSAMEEVVIGILYTGCMESGDYYKMQITKDGVNWNNVLQRNGGCYGEGDWYLHGGSNSKYQGYSLASTYFGTDDTANIKWRIQFDGDNDENTESGSRPYSGWFIDQIVFRGTERITRDVAVGDITVDSEFSVKNDEGDQTERYREINATIINAGEKSWPNFGVEMTITNLQGTDMSGMMDIADTDNIVTIPELPAATSDGGKVNPVFYGDITKDASEDKVFSLFRCPEANTYYVKVKALAPKDFFPWNNTKIFTFRVFDTFFDDDADGTSLDWTLVERVAADGLNTWSVRTVGTNAYSGDRVWAYGKEDGWNKENPTTVAGRDDSLITQDEYDRGAEFDKDVNVDLRAAFKPILSFAIKYDLAVGDRLEVRAATDFDSDQRLSSGTWTVLKTYTESCTCTWNSVDDEQWVIEELSLEAFEGFQTWIDFRVVTVAGGGNGVMLDDIMVIGNEYRNNLGVDSVVTERYSASGETHDLSVTVRGIGLEPQSGIVVTSVIRDSNNVRVWPAGPSNQFNYFTIPVALAKGETFTVNTATAGSEWTWGSGLAPGIYKLEVQAWRGNEQDVNDENPVDNVQTMTIVLGAALLTGDQWTMGSGWSSGSYVWNGQTDGYLTSDEFVLWNSKPFLVVEADYDLTKASVKAQVRSGTANWYDIKWRANDQLSTLYTIPGQANLTTLPDTWTGSSAFDNSTTHTFFADLASVNYLDDGTGKIQDKFIGQEMQIRLSGIVEDDGSAMNHFTAFYPSVFGLDSYSVDVKKVSPTTQNAQPSVGTADGTMLDKVEVPYVVEVSNFGAASDALVVDFVITAPASTFVKLADGTSAVLDSILQQGSNTVVAIKPISGGKWGGLNLDPERDDPAGGDNTAYIAESGAVTWPSGKNDPGVDTPFTSTGWKIINPTKSKWDSVEGKPDTPGPGDMVSPGKVSAVSVLVQVGYASWAIPGTYGIQADAKSWSDYDNTFTELDSDGQATMIIARPDLSIDTDTVKYTSHATGYGESGVGWVKKSGCEGSATGINCVEDPYFSFMFQVLNSGTETVGSFKVGLLDIDGNTLSGIQVGLKWTNSGWEIDPAATSAEGAEIITVDSKNYIFFKATASQLDMSEGPGDQVKGTYTFYLAVDTEGVVKESNENNNEFAITITAVKEVNTVPSFSLSVLGMSLSGLLAALGISLRQKREEE